MFRYIFVALLVCAVAADLTEDERVIFKQTWAPHAAHPQETGVKIFGGFLKANHDIKAQFPKFKDVSDDELDNNVDFKSHALKIFNIFNDAFAKKNWNDVEQLSSFHKEIGQTNKVYFNKFRAYIIDYMNLNAEQTVIWNKALDNFFNHLFAKF